MSQEWLHALNEHNLQSIELEQLNDADESDEKDEAAAAESKEVRQQELDGLEGDGDGFGDNEGDGFSDGGGLDNQNAFDYGEEEDENGENGPSDLAERERAALPQSASSSSASISSSSSSSTSSMWSGSSTTTTQQPLLPVTALSRDDLDLIERFDSLLPKAVSTYAWCDQVKRLVPPQLKDWPLLSRSQYRQIIESFPKADFMPPIFTTAASLIDSSKTLNPEEKRSVNLIRSVYPNQQRKQINIVRATLAGMNELLMGHAQAAIGYFMMTVRLGLNEAAHTVQLQVESALRLAGLDPRTLKAMKDEKKSCINSDELQELQRLH
jgi:hypothetical protein